MKKPTRILLFVLLAVFTIAGYVAWRQSGGASPSGVETRFDEAKEKRLAAEGEALARQHCASCHIFPEPSLLDKLTWVNSTLPSMGDYFGIMEHQGMHGHKRLTREADLLNRPQIRVQIRMMDEQTIISKDWEKILCYYHYRAPEDLMQGEEMSTSPANITYFEHHAMKHPALAGKRPLTTCVKILPSQRRIAFGSANSPDIRLASLASGKLQLTASIKAGAPTVSIESASDSSLTITTIGEMKPTEKHLGKLLHHISNATNTLISGLHRPVSGKPFDANGDKHMDYLICEYGHHTGRLTWLETQSDGSRQKHIILEKANPIAAIPHDADSDGDTDIYALFAGGREGIWLFTNDGKGNFASKEIVPFPAPTGSSSLKLADIDGDGDMDLLHTSGDNDDSSKILKPYHGLRIYLNDGKQNFNLAHHYPMHGAYQVAAADFDLDGDMDIALCAHFIDHQNQPEQAFVILRNDGKLRFTAQSHPATHGIRWLVMDAGDIDGDGDTDIVLGAMIPHGKNWLTPSQQTLKKWQDAPEILLLENQTR